MAKEILVVQVGTDSRPAGEADIKDVAKKLKKILRDSGDTETSLFVTHHAINMHTLSSIDYQRSERCSEMLQLFDKGIATADEVRKYFGL